VRTESEFRIAILGRTEFLLKAAKDLVAEGFTLTAVVTAPESPHYLATSRDFERFARDVDVPFLGVSRYDSDVRDLLRDSKSDVVFSVNWPHLLKASDLEITAFGIVNAHAGDLPRYRGNACPNWAILNGESEIGLTLHLMEPDGLDSGDILLKRFFPVSTETYIGDCYSWMRTHIPSMFVELAKNWGSLWRARIPQETLPITPLRCFPRTPEDSRIDWTRPAVEICRLVRASSEPFDGAFTLYDDEVLRILRAREVELTYDISAVPGSILFRRDDGVAIASGDGVVLVQVAEFDKTSKLASEDGIKALGRRLRARLR